MSKSVEGSYIGLTDSLEEIREKLAGAPTDSGHGEKLPEEGGVANLLTLVDLFMGDEKRERYKDLYLGSGLKYQELKEELAQAIYEELKPIQERRKHFEEHPREVEEILEAGRKYCAEIAKNTLAEVKKAMGLVL